MKWTKEYKKQYRREYAKNNRDKVNECNRKYYEKNKEKYKEAQDRYVAKYFEKRKLILEERKKDIRKNGLLIIPKNVKYEKQYIDNWFKQNNIVQENFTRKIKIIRTSRKRKYYGFKINKIFYYLHRIIYEGATGIKIPPKMHIHHKDENPSNNIFSNLLLISSSDHAKIPKTLVKINKEKRIKNKINNKL